MRIPASTYRLQFNRSLTFAQGTAMIDYLALLGVTDVYASPLLAASPGSPHGYDVVDHGRWNPDLGSAEELERLCRTLRDRSMGLIMDVVPNHMCISGSRNQWWNEVLRDGPSSQYARFFDIDWQPPKAAMYGKLLCPVLGRPFGRTLESGDIRLAYEPDGDLLVARYGDLVLPLSAPSWRLVLQGVLDALRQEVGDGADQVLELESILRAIGYLVPNGKDEPVRARQREQPVLRQRLRALLGGSSDALRALQAELAELNGHPGQARSFDRLEGLLREQIYRLAYWRVAAEEINYRRFFDVNDLAAIRVEEPAVFLAVHRLILGLVEQGLVTGLRVDHVDGLFDPWRYLTSLQGVCRLKLGRGELAERAIYLVVEKILTGTERLRGDWPVHGTTGYEFLNLVGGVLMDAASGAALHAVYRRFVRGDVSWADLAYDGKKLVLQASLSSELHVLTTKLARIAEQHRSTRDLTFNNLKQALAEVIACFPVYRSYIRYEAGVALISEADRELVGLAMAEARARSPVLSGAVFDFIEGVILGQGPADLLEEQQGERREFVLRLQQLTGPVMAKGVEDTAFYRYSELVALCEVGGDPERVGVPVAAFHQANAERMASWPHSMVCTATHDTKRGEDVRARLCVLSELPEAWEDTARRLRHVARGYKREVHGVEVPGGQEEYLLYQTVLGTLPEGGLLPDDEAGQRVYRERVNEYMLKAVKEAKLHTSWIRPNEPYEEALRAFVHAVLDPGGGVLSELSRLLPKVSACGRYNSLTQVLCKIGAPGVPDFYQGTELLDLTLVDPDNRRPVDSGLAWLLLRELDQQEEQLGQGELARRLLAGGDGGRLKLYVTSRGLRFRRAHGALMADGGYAPLEATGAQVDHVVAFARRAEGEAAIFVGGRLFVGLGVPGVDPVGAVWRDTELVVPAGLRGRYREVFSGAEVDAGAGVVKLAQVLAALPVALLERIDRDARSAAVIDRPPELQGSI